MNPPRIILVAGVPRSGSTWLFNAVRRILEEAGESFHSAWISTWDRDQPAHTHLVKIHNPGAVDFHADFVFTTHRPTADCLASLIRMGWLNPDPKSIRACWERHEKLYDHWKQRTTLEVTYDEIMNRPKEALSRLAATLCIWSIEDSCLEQIAKELREMRAPDEGEYDPTTLLHPGHRKSTMAEGPTPEEVLAIMADG